MMKEAQVWMKVITPLLQRSRKNWSWFLKWNITKVK
jgi:hypothetical protein